jgi:hypothetical protein
VAPGPRVNLVNQRREFFYATPGEVKALLKQHAGYLLEFVDEPEAPEWRQSEGERQRRQLTARPSDAGVERSTVSGGKR